MGWRAEWYIVLRRNVADRLTLGVAVFKQGEATLIKKRSFLVWGRAWPEDPQH